MLLLGIGCVVLGCSIGTWLVARPPIPLLVAPDATGIRVVASDWWAWTITYRTPGPPYGWYSTIERRLEATGWTRQGERYTGGPLHEPATCTRMISFGFVALWERVELDGDLHGAHVRMRRWIAIQPLKL